MLKSVQIGPPRGVDIGQVERELAALWDEATRLPGPGAEPTVTRACSMNLVAVSADPARAAEEGEVLGDVSVAHPARILRILEAPGAAPRVTVSARCTVPQPGRGQVCSEEIVISAEPAPGGSLVAIISSLLVADVPTIVLWRRPVDLDDPLLVPLSTMADRVLVDSTGADDPPAMLRAWHELMMTGRDRGRFGETLAGDLSWTRLHGVRTVLAAAVGAPAMRPVLEESTGLMIEWSGGALAQALLLGSWYASRLGWTVRRARLSGTEHSLECEEGRAIRLRRHDGGGGIHRVTLGGGPRRAVELRRTATPGCALVVRRHDEITTEEHIRHAEYVTEASLLVRELEMLEHDSAYERAMDWLAGALGARR